VISRANLIEAANQPPRATLPGTIRWNNPREPGVRRFQSAEPDRAANGSKIIQWLRRGQTGLGR
jgi:hypothetical protein